MQLKGMVKLFTAALILFSLWRLSFTFIAHNVDVKTKAKAEKSVSINSPEAKGSDREFLVDKAVQHLNDSMRDETVFNFLGAKYTYSEVKGKELQLGLDLQGGMSVTLEVGLDGLVSSMSNNPHDQNLKRAIDEALRMKANSNADFPSLFAQAYEKIVPGGKLAPLFMKQSQPSITYTSTNADVVKVIQAKAKEAIKSTFNVLSKRIDKFGVAQPSINLDESKGIIIVELAGVKDPESVRKVLQATAKLQFWELATLADEKGNPTATYSQIIKANDAVANYLKGTKSLNAKDSLAQGALDTSSVANADTAAANTIASKSDTAKGDTASLTGLLNNTDNKSKGEAASGDLAKQQTASLFSIMDPLIDPKTGQPAHAPYIGVVSRKDAAQLRKYLDLDVVKNLFPPNIKFLFGNLETGPENRERNKKFYAVYAVQTVLGSDKAKLEGDHVKSAKFDYQNGQGEVSLTMDPQGTPMWANLTGANVGRPIAITLDDYVYSAPNVIQKMTDGRSSITGGFNAAEGTDLANILETGKLDAPAKIVQEQVVGPTLGQESIDGGIKSFAIAFLIIFSLMILYYSSGGIVANIALILNMLFTFGILANLGATLTMAGIAGIVLGIGMAVDTNVIIFERIKEELSLGDTYEEAVSKGYKRSYAPVLDGHVTSLITAIILYVFGLGPIKGFATTQILAILLSLFTGIMVSRLITDTYMKRGRHFNYFTKLSKSIFQKAHFKFIEKRKIAYVFSSILILAGIASFFNGFNYGVEFDGGRSYTIKFDQVHKEGELREILMPYLDNKRPVVKKIGVATQLDITTDYLITDPDKDAEQKVIARIHEGLQKNNLIPANVDVTTFENKYIQSKKTVLPTISADLKRGAIWATLVAVICIFIYIGIRFRKWQYSLGTVVAVIHDAAVTLAVFSFFKNIVPFTLEIDQHFIAALLTVIGFSMNDTVIVFDRIREYFRKTPNGNKTDVVNRAINDTLSRTIMTSLTVFITAVVLFIFGGEVLRGFAFAMAIGVLAGTYSSIFVAAPILVDLDKSDSLRVEEDKDHRIRTLKEQA